MNAKTSKLPRLPGKNGMALLIGGIATIIVMLTALATALTPFPGAAKLGVTPSPAVAPAGVRARRCAECGVVESVREVSDAAQAEPALALGEIRTGNNDAVSAVATRAREITIRLPDGSLRMITDADPARWRQGERVSFIAGQD